jgi:DNA gyrase subunit A
MKRFKLSEIQAKAILDMRLQRLTGLERKKIEEEYRETIKLIERLRAILKSKQLQMQIIKDELLELKQKYGDERRTEIVYKAEEFSIEDMIAEEQVVITVSHGGFVKRFPVSGYRRQTRGGRGSTGATTKEDDFIEHVFVGSTHDYMLLFTDKGRCYWLKVFEIPEGGRSSRGKSIVNLISKEVEETIASFVAVKDFDADQFVVMLTQQGIIKKTSVREFSNPRRTGIAAIGLGKGDRLIDVKLTDGSQDILIGTLHGLAIRFHEKEARPMGRAAAGVRAIKLGKGDRAIGSVSLRRSGTSILIATNGGYGKRSETGEYRLSHRGGKGIITVKITEKTGEMVAIREVVDTDDIVVVTTNGIVIRQHAKEVRLAGRNTQGVRLIRLEEGDTISDVTIVAAGEEPPEKNDLLSGDKAERGKAPDRQRDAQDDAEKKSKGGGKREGPVKKTAEEPEQKTPKSTMEPDRETGKKKHTSGKQEKIPSKPPAKGKKK